MSKQPPQNPAGEFVPPGDYRQDDKLALLERMLSAPSKLASAVEGLDDSQLDTKYRNWTIRQIVHHLADSHIHCYLRFKFALTESTPTIKAYDESKWSEEVDARTQSIESSLQILTGVHQRWTEMVKALSDEQMQRAYFHPELDCEVTLKEALPMYVWHADHHTEQIRWVREQHGW
jgi:hypothetical protein